MSIPRKGPGKLINHLILTGCVLQRRHVNTNCMASWLIVIEHLLSDYRSRATGDFLKACYYGTNKKPWQLVLPAMTLKCLTTGVLQIAIQILWPKKKSKNVS